MNKKMEKIRDTLKDVIERRMDALTPGTKLDFIRVVFSIRYLVSTDPTSLSAIWGGIRINNELVDFITDGTREFLLRAFIPGQYEFEKLTDEIASTYALLGNKNSSLDDTLKDSILNQEDIKKVFFSNPWFTFLYMSENLITMVKENEPE